MKVQIIFAILILVQVNAWPTKYVKINEVLPRLQWPDRDGYCGSLSIQSIALSFGSYISQDIVRKAVGNQEIGPQEAPEAIKNLKFNHDSWDYSAYSIPQTEKFLVWMKGHIAKGESVVTFVYTHESWEDLGYVGFTHIEPFYGVLSDYPLDDGLWHDEDVIVHNSDWDKEAFYRPFKSLPDDSACDGNCHNASTVIGKNEKYPCLANDADDFGVAILGPIDPKGILLPVTLAINSWSEPDIIEGVSPSQFTGTVTVNGLTAGEKYVIYRYDDYTNVPTDSNYNNGKQTKTIPFTASDKTYTVVDPDTFISNSSTYYRCIKAETFLE